MAPGEYFFCDGCRENCDKPHLFLDVYFIWLKLVCSIIKLTNEWGMMIRAIAIEDEPSALAHLADCLRAVPDIELVASFSTIADALKFLREAGDVDLIFCDIELPDVSGLEASDWLKGYTTDLVFITGHNHRALDAYRKYVKYFIVKPVTAVDLQNLLEELLGARRASQPLKLKYGKLLFYDGSKKTYTPAKPDEVVKLVQAGNYVDVHLHNHDAPICIRCPLTQAMAVLEPLGLFLQISRSAIINLDKVRSFHPDSVTIGADTHGVGEPHKAAYLDFVRRFQMGKGNGMQ